MGFIINGQEYRAPPLTASTLRKLKQIAGVPMVDMDVYTFVQAATALAAGCTFFEAGELWQRHLAEHGPEETRRVLDAVADSLNDQVNNTLAWIARRSPAVQAKWRQAYNKGV